MTERISPLSLDPSGVRTQIGIQAPLHYAYGRDLVRGVQTYALEHARWDLWWDQHGTPDFPETHPIDGLIAVIHLEENVRRYEELAIPVVAATGVVAQGRLPLVSVDNLPTGRLAADYLVDLGFEHFFYYSALPPDRDGRRLGYLERIQQRKPGAQVFEVPRAGNFREWPPIKRQVQLVQFMKDLPLPFAALAADDTLAVEVITACHRSGLQVPDQVAVLGVDNDELACGLCQPPLSSIDLSATEVGYRAAEILHQRLQGKQVSLEPIIVPPTGVVERPSTQTLAIHDPDLTMALRCIKQSACDGLTAHEVVDQVSVSRTALEKRFQKHLGRSIHQQLVRERIEHVKRLLRTTDLPMPDIAARSGFSYASQLSHVFRREVGQTPRDYRQKQRMLTDSSRAF